VPTVTGVIGILAGGGRLPLLVGESVQQRGGRVHIIGIAGEADAAIARFPHSWVRWGEIGRLVQRLREAGCGELVIAGAVRRPHLRQLRPDVGLLSNLPQVLRLLAGGDDGVLTAVVRFFEGKGVRVVGAHQVAPDLLAASGTLGKVALGAAEHADARLGFAVRRALAPVDAGQAVVVAAGRVVAIEGVEGTDAMLQRVAARATEGMSGPAGVLTKGPKPRQELRVDMPVIGPGTIAQALAAGLKGVVVEAGAVLVVDKAAMLTSADAGACAVYGLARDRGRPQRLAAPRRGRVMGRVCPGRRQRQDLACAVAAVAALVPFELYSSVVVERSHVLAIELGADGAGMLERVGTLRQWGLRGRRRSGVCAVRARPGGGAGDLEAMLAVASQQRLAGVAALGSESALKGYEAMARLADRLGIFLAVFAEETQAP
jgi:DUF1009 family protein